MGHRPGTARVMSATDMQSTREKQKVLVQFQTVLREPLVAFGLEAKKHTFLGRQPEPACRALRPRRRREDHG
eukprot:2299610-Rhodomonas_salina.1